MRRTLAFVIFAACGPSSRPAPVTDPPVVVPDAGVSAVTSSVQVVLPTNVGVVVACPGDVDGVGGGFACAVDEPDVVVTGCADAHGALHGTTLIADDMLMPFTLLGATVQPITTPSTDPRDKRTHEVDLDGDGDPEQIILVPHDNRASYGRSLSLVDGHDPLMTDDLDPFPDAADLQLLGSSDVDGDGRRELILYAPDEDGFGIAVQEYWSANEAYRLDCRNP